MKRIILLYLILVLALGTIIFVRSEFFDNQKSKVANIIPGLQPSIPVKNPTATINNQTFKVLLAETSAQQIKGLSDREKLDQDTGMLFVFPQKAPYSFWMKNMKFAIDIIYIDDDTIVDIFNNVPLPQADINPLPTYSPQADANYVLEINANLSKKYGFKVGDKVSFKEIGK